MKTIQSDTENLIKEFKRIYRIEPTSVMLEQFKKHKPSTFHFRGEEIENMKRVCRENMPRMGDFRSNKLKTT